MAFTPYSAQAWEFNDPYSLPDERSIQYSVEPKTVTWRAAGLLCSQAILIVTRVTTSVYSRNDIAYDGGSVADIPINASSKTAEYYTLGEGLTETSIKYISREEEHAYEFTPDDRAGRAKLTYTKTVIIRNIVTNGTIQ